MHIQFVGQDFQSSGRLVLKVNFDIMQSWSGGDARRVVEGADFDGTSFEAVFAAPHFQTATVDGFFRNVYANPATTYGLNLPDDSYDNAAAIFTTNMPPAAPPEPVFTAGVLASIEQTPLPITLSGTVFEDLSDDNHQQSGEPGIAGVPLSLYELQGSDYVATGKTTTTDANGNYKFDNLLPGTYKVVETQPDGYLSVGATAGTVGGATRGVVTSVDVLSSINLDGGDDSIHNDFAEIRPAEVSGHVYYDANDNGVFDAGETPLSGVQVTLLDANGNSTGLTATTDDSGSYRFGNLMPGTYGVSEAQPDGYLDGLDAAGTAGGKAHNPGDLIDGISLASNQSGRNYDFGELLPASLSGFVYVDTNNNGVFDAGEAPIADVQLTLLDASGKPTGLTATTDTSGFYRFENLAPGMYGVAEAQPAGYYDGLDAPGTIGGTAHNPGDLIDGVSLPSGVAAKEYDFGELLPASISGQVFADLNNNSALDSGEPLLVGVTIYLLDASGNQLTSTATDAQGKYSFVDLRPDVYGVQEVQPANYLEGGNRVGSAGGALDGPDRTLSAALGSGVNGVNYDFWEEVPAKISGYVFQDGATIVVKDTDPPPNIPALRDGQLTPDDKRLSGVVLQLCDGSGVPASGRPRQPDHHGDRRQRLLRVRYALFGRVFDPGDCQPGQYLPGIDTAGSKGGLVVNRYSTVDASMLLTLYGRSPFRQCDRADSDQSGRRGRAIQLQRGAWWSQHRRTTRRRSYRRPIRRRQRLRCLRRLALPFVEYRGIPRPYNVAAGDRDPAAVLRRSGGPGRIPPGT